MNRYVIRFEKNGVIRYTSHLDMLRLFKRSFKRVGVRLVHSQGFNPHPRMSFAQPLSLGYESAGDYLEFDTEEEYDPRELMERLNSALPQGIAATACRQVSTKGKSLSARIEAGSYEIRIPVGAGRFAEGRDFSETLAAFLKQPEIMAEKRQKKTKQMAWVDIKPLILECNGALSNDNNITLTTLVRSGSGANLNPELIARSFLSFLDIPYEKGMVRIRRLELYCSAESGELTPAMESLPPETK